MKTVSTLVATLLLASVASAQYKTSTYSTSSYTASDRGGGRNFISGALGFMAPGQNVLYGTNSSGNGQTAVFNLSGFFGIGGDYDYMWKKDLSVGGFLRYYSTTSNYNNSNFKNSLFTLGPDLRGYLQNETWVAYMGAGFAYILPTYTQDNNTISVDGTFGLMMEIGMLYKVSETFGLGLENMRLIGLSSKVNGIPLDDLMVKARFSID